MIVPASGGLTDLAGKPVIAPGEPDGVLASWTVQSSVPERRSPATWAYFGRATGGAIWPTANGSFLETTTLAPGQGATFRWTVIVPGLYKLQSQVVRKLDRGRELVRRQLRPYLDAGSTDHLNNYLMMLSAGVYELRFTNVGSQQADVDWLLKIESLDWEKIINNGISQSSALSLMTFTPQPTDNTAAGVETGLLSIPPSAVGETFTGAVGPVPANLLVTLNAALAGQPSWDGEALVGTGPVVDTGVGLAGQALSAPYPSFVGSDSRSDNEALAVNQQATSDGVAGTGPIASGTETVLSSNLDSSACADIRALAEADWVNRIGSLVQDWFSSSRPASPSRLIVAEPASSRPSVVREPGPFSVKAPANSWRNRQLLTMLRGEISATASLLVVGVVAYRLRHPIRRWWRDERASRRTGKASCTPGPAPEPSNLARVKTACAQGVICEKKGRPVLWATRTRLRKGILSRPISTNDQDSIALVLLRSKMSTDRGGKDAADDEGRGIDHDARSLW